MKLTPRVIDLSHWDDIKDKFKGTVKAGIWGVINKVTENTAMEDHSFDWRRKPCADAGLLYGAYHFIRPGNIQAQAEWFLKNCGVLDGLLLALDHEDPKVPLPDAKKWLQIVHDKTGRWPVLYSGFLIKEQLGMSGHDPFFDNVKLWLSHFSANPTWPKTWTAPFFIQFTGDGVGPKPHNIAGIDAGDGLDINHYGGTQDQLKAEWAI